MPINVLLTPITFGIRNGIIWTQLPTTLVITYEVLNVRNKMLNPSTLFILKGFNTRTGGINLIRSTAKLFNV